MGASCRHYKALMKKNFINWKRTPCGSITEILLPIGLMMILVWARAKIDPEPTENYSLYSLRHPLYPIAKPDDSADGNYTVNIGDSLNEIGEYQDFMTYSNYLNINTTVQLPVDTVFSVVNLDDDVEDFIDDVQETVKNFTNLAEVIENTQIVNISKAIDWDAVEELLEALGLSSVINAT
jgi:hypothetical protein